MNIIYKLNISDIEVIKNFIKKNDKLFNPRLSQQIDIESYVKKIKTNATIFEAYCDDILRGIIAVYLNDCTKIGYITLVLCDYEFLHQGIISNLYDFFESYVLKNTNIETLHLETQNTNIKAINLYEKKGFIKMIINKGKLQMQKKI